MSAGFDALESLIPPPRRALSEPEWTVLEERLGLRLPFDYKRTRLLSTLSHNLRSGGNSTPAAGGDGGHRREPRPPVGPAAQPAIVESYGPGSFGGFFWVLQPSSTNQYLDLLRQRDVRLDTLRTLAKSGEVVPYALDPGREEIMPWAFTDNGDVCFWVTSASADPGEWGVAVNEGREPVWMTFGGSASEFLVAVFSGALRVEMFPEDFPSKAPVFEIVAA